ncbi:hypothetical protein F4778DRAFT_776074 [Xylariomycetidae sp. FL2044]|nr:hypothetical protein F4778DRAFT_776074 [Xylariomycetidae sp. FL2044]
MSSSYVADDDDGNGGDSTKYMEDIQKSGLLIQQDVVLNSPNHIAQQGEISLDNFQSMNEQALLENIASQESVTETTTEWDTTTDARTLTKTSTETETETSTQTKTTTSVFTKILEQITTLFISKTDTPTAAVYVPTAEIIVTTEIETWTTTEFETMANLVSLPLDDVNYI